MNPTTTLLVLVDQATPELGQRIRDRVDTLSEVSPRFEVLILSWKRDEDTEEIAESLAREFPQIRLAQVDPCGDRDQAIQVGYRHARGDILLIDDARSPFRPSRVARSRAKVC